MQPLDLRWAHRYDCCLAGVFRGDFIGGEGAGGIRVLGGYPPHICDHYTGEKSGDLVQQLSWISLSWGQISFGYFCGVNSWICWWESFLERCFHINISICLSRNLLAILSYVIKHYKLDLELHQSIVACTIWGLIVNDTVIFLVDCVVDARVQIPVWRSCCDWDGDASCRRQQ